MKKLLLTLLAFLSFSPSAIAFPFTSPPAFHPDDQGRVFFYSPDRTWDIPLQFELDGSLVVRIRANLCGQLIVRGRTQYPRLGGGYQVRDTAGNLLLDIDGQLQPITNPTNEPTCNSSGQLSAPPQQSGYMLFDAQSSIVKVGLVGNFTPGTVYSVTVSEVPPPPRLVRPNACGFFSLRLGPGQRVAGVRDLAGSLLFTLPTDTPRMRGPICRRVRGFPVVYVPVSPWIE